MERGGFDTVIGNPPFLTGSDISGVIGGNVRDWFVHMLACGQRGNADLVAYFFLRAMELLAKRGTLGLIATNSIAQGKSREVGLDRMIASGFTITRSIQSRPWPAVSASLEYAAVWGSCGEVAADTPRVADGVEVRSITTLLEPAGRVDGPRVKLVENLGLAFQGCMPSGAGFIITAEKANEWLDADMRNKQVLFPFFNGDDLNSHADTYSARWIIDFNDRPESISKAFTGPYTHALRRVKPQREKGSIGMRQAPWWLFERSRPSMRKAISDFSEVLAMTKHSVTLMPRRVPTTNVFGHGLVVFATDSFSDQAVLSSSPHQLWAIKYGSGLRKDPRYTASDVFETFPRPKPTRLLAEIGEILETERRSIMLRRDLGLTKLYNLVNDPAITDAVDADVARMREIHVKLDQVVVDAYGWSDVPLEHDFHTYRQMQRWTVSPATRVEILDRLLDENHRRAAAQGEAPPPVDIEDEEGAE
jgi:hypothetical protein